MKIFLIFNTRDHPRIAFEIAFTKYEDAKDWVTSKPNQYHDNTEDVRVEDLEVGEIVDFTHYSIECHELFDKHDVHQARKQEIAESIAKLQAELETLT